jgi:Xaa-Pro aminopeptidase
VQQAAIRRLEPGLSWRDHERAMVADMGRQLVRLGLLGANDLKAADATTRIHRFYPHAGSHSVGLDVHDVGARDSFEAGMVVTVEPGIYVPSEGIGIRLEDDILITATGHENLSGDIPIELTQVEAMIREHR